MSRRYAAVAQVSASPCVGQQISPERLFNGEPPSRVRKLFLEREESSNTVNVSVVEGGAAIHGLNNKLPINTIMLGNVGLHFPYKLVHKYSIS